MAARAVVLRLTLLACVACVVCVTEAAAAMDRGSLTPAARHESSRLAADDEERRGERLAAAGDLKVEEPLFLLAPARPKRHLVPLWEACCMVVTSHVAKSSHAGDSASA